MDRIIAEKLMEQYHRLNDPLNQATEIISTISDKDEQKRLRRPIGEMMVSLWTDLMSPIAKEYPDLDPDKQGSK